MNRTDRDTAPHSEGCDGNTPADGNAAPWSAPKLQRIAAADTEGKIASLTEDDPAPGFGPS